MSTLLAAPLLLALLVSTPAAPHGEEWDTPGARHLELTAENADVQHPVRIRPHESTTLVFDTPLQPGGVRVEDGQGVKVAVSEAEGVVLLLPTRAPPLDRPPRVTVRFADGQVPGGVTFRLVEDVLRAEHQVRVYRQPRSGESLQLESRQQRERAEWCEAALAQERARPPGPCSGSLQGLLEAGLVGEGLGILARELMSSLSSRPGAPLMVTEAWSYRAEARQQVAVELNVKNTSALAWTTEGAELVSTEGVRLRVTRVWQSGPLLPEGQVRLVVEAEAPEKKQLQSTFLLKLGEAGGARTFTVRGVAFP
ncbi:MAG TPA: DUF2381 family protein [Archangium sp.]|uniref:DUF2381 family protein n=1 Tax=Archangium sp. TaxID=1872627 RepID=UPI002E33EEDF|nr:DUF2381 family protein [Archangium sp.]HEX5752095.1 DUF2381 family protein [Archangium sp.]